MSFKYFLILQLCSISTFSSESFSSNDLERVTFKREDRTDYMGHNKWTIFSDIKIDGQEYLPTNETARSLTRIMNYQISDQEAQGLILADYLDK